MKTRIILLLAIASISACKESNKENRVSAQDAVATDAAPSATTNNSDRSPEMTSDGLVHSVPYVPTAGIASGVPAAEHAQLAASEGSWRTEMTYWASADAKPSVVRGMCDIRMILGGRYQQSVYRSDDGKGFEGVGYIAYDNARKMYISTWMDNTTTGVVYLEGNYDGSEASTEMEGKCTEVVACRQRGMRQITRNIDENTQIMETYESRPGTNEYKSMEIKFTRVPGRGAMSNDLAALH